MDERYLFLFDSLVFALTGLLFFARVVLSARRGETAYALLLRTRCS